jgi:hypothetical protein
VNLGGKGRTEATLKPFTPLLYHTTPNNQFTFIIVKVNKIIPISRNFSAPFGTYKNLHKKMPQTAQKQLKKQPQSAPADLAEVVQP